MAPRVEGFLVATATDVAALQAADTNLQSLITTLQSINSARVGVVSSWAGVGVNPPTGYLFSYGQNVSRSTYSALFAVLSRSATVTITIASPAVISWSAHGLGAGDPVIFKTTGALPTGLTAGTVYYVIAAGLAAGSFRVAASPGGAAINTSGSQNGVHTGWYIPFGDGDGSTTFTLPDLRGRVVAHEDDVGGTSANRLTGLGGGVDGDVLGATGGEETHVLTPAELAAHLHDQAVNTVLNVGGSKAVASGTARDTGGVTASKGSDTAHNNVQPVIILRPVIFTGV